MLAKKCKSFCQHLQRELKRKTTQVGENRRMNEGREEGTSGKKTVWIFCKDLSARLLDSTLVSHPERRCCWSEKNSLWRIKTLQNFPVKSRALKARLSGLNKVLLLCDFVFHAAIMSQEIRWGQNIRKLHSLYSCVQTLFCFWILNLFGRISNHKYGMYALLCVASSQQGIFRHFCEKTPSSLKSQIPRPFRLFNSLASFKSQLQNWSNLDI